tara:strand:- start:6491 stop:6775 length:285 start_codon:yes stop_codon:yes gene_type:complete
MSMDNEPRDRDGYAFVFVDWVDSSEPIDNSDIGVYELPEPQRIFQCGFLIHEEEGYVVVAGAVKPTLEQFDYTIAIPRVAINAIRQLAFPGDFE